MTQTLKGYWDTDRLSCDTTIVLPRGRVQSVTTVSGASGSPVLDPAAYQVTGAVITMQSAAWTPMSVIWVSGYGDNPEDVPDNVREGILEYATVLYSDRPGQRETRFASSSATKLPPGIADLWRGEQIEIGG
jgi:hypothetical protein